MKSFSDNLPNSEKVVSQEQFAQTIAEIRKVFVAVRNWMFGLAAFNLIVTVVLFVVTKHQ